MSQQLIARDRELRVLLDALDAARPGARAVVLEGEAGLGKTALWRQALDAAPDRGWRVLASAPARSEARLAFAALGDLFDVDIEPALSALPGPQRRALEVALLRHGDEPSIGSVDERMIGVATLSALRALAAYTPCVVAFDDLHGSTPRRPPRCVSPCAACARSRSWSWPPGAFRSGRPRRWRSSGCLATSGCSVFALDRSASVACTSCCSRGSASRSPGRPCFACTSSPPATRSTRWRSVGS